MLRSPSNNTYQVIIKTTPTPTKKTTGPNKKRKEIRTRIERISEEEKGEVKRKKKGEERKERE